MCYLNRGIPRVFKEKHLRKKKLESNSEVIMPLKQLGTIELVSVSDRELSDIWNDMMNTYHYLGNGPLCGAQYRYLISNKEWGWLGGLSFSSATWRLKARDKEIGWSEAARRVNLSRVVCNSRFLILPYVKVENLASHVLSQCVKRLRSDWEVQYGCLPLLIETFVNPNFFQGSCYRAANWKHIGQTAGRQTPFPNGKISDGRKDIYIYPLQRNWKSVLCTEPVSRLCDIPRPDHVQDWVEGEFSTVTLYDDRLKSRLFMLARDFFAQPGALIPQACEGSEAKMKAAYRFFENNKVTMKTLLKPHTESSVERIRKHAVVLAVQDTTVLKLYNPSIDQRIGSN